jgi:hypothetical protein
MNQKSDIFLFKNVLISILAYTGGLVGASAAFFLGIETIN